MRLEYVPLLHTQRDLYALPRGPERFQAYLRTMVDPNSRDLRVPLAGMNPMGKDHLPPFLDGLLAMDAEGVAAAAVGELAAALEAEPGDYSVCLVVSDDLKGGWTNRYAAEFAYRFDQRAYTKRGWIAVTLWTSEAYTPALVAQEVRVALHRSAYIAHHGQAATLGDMLTQEGYALAGGGATEPRLEPAALERAVAILTPLLGRTEQPVLMAALFGDAGAVELGYPPLWLPPRAGLALALHREQQARAGRPEHR